MKKFIYPLILIIISISCTDFEMDDLVLNLKPVGNYVAFANSGGTVAPINLNRTESSTASNLRIENATGSLSNITVTYEFSGTAIFGTDFTVTSPGGTVTSTGGTIVITATNKKSTVADFAFVNLVIDPITDGVVDGDKSLTVTIISAVNADGVEFIVGRGAEGGTVYLKTATINIADVN